MKLYANPFNKSKDGFYFESASEFESKSKTLNCEEYEIDFIDSDAINGDLFGRLGCNQSNLEEVFELVGKIELLDQKQITAFEFLLDCNTINSIGDLECLIDKIDDVCVTDDSLYDYAYNLMQDCYDIPENLIDYIDYDKFGRDLEIEGSVVRFKGYLITNANDF